MHLQCKQCDWEGMPNIEKIGDHLKATCRKCLAYIKLVGGKNLDALNEKMNLLIEEHEAMVEDNAVHMAEVAYMEQHSVMIKISGPDGAHLMDLAKDAIRDINSMDGEHHAKLNES